MTKQKKKVGRKYKYGERTKNVQSKVPMSKVGEFETLRDKFLSRFIVAK